MYSVYILECSDGSLYTGIARDVTRRVDEHRRGKGARYTRSHGVKALRYVEEVGTRSAAQKREASIKGLSREKKLLLINERGML